MISSPSTLPEKQPRWSYRSVGIVNVVSVSSNALYIVMGTSDGYVYLFNSSCNIPLGAANIGGSVSAISVSFHGKYVAAVTGNTLRVYTINNSFILSWSFTNDAGGSGSIHSLDFSEDGDLLVVGTRTSGVYQMSRSWVHLFNVTTGPTPIWSRKMNEGNYLNDAISVDISDDGNYIVAGSASDHKVYLFNQTSSTPLISYDTGSAVNSVSMATDGHHFVAGSNYIYYFSKDIIVPLWICDIGGTVNSVSISDDSTYIAAARGTYLYLLKNDNTELWRHNVATIIGQAVISADGSHVVLRSGNYVHLFSRIVDGNLTTSTHDPIWSYDAKSTINTISISLDGKYTIFGSNGKIFFFDEQHKADLVPTSMSFSNDKPNEGDIITISATVNNTGSYKSYYANVSFYDGQTLIGIVQINPISPNSSTIVTATYQCVAGNRTIKVVVDPDTMIHESDKTNNYFTKSIFVNPRPTPVILYDPTDITATSMKLTWTRNTDPDFVKYEVYISTNQDLWTLIASITNQSQTAYTVTGLSASTTYYFIIRVVTNSSFSDSNQVSGTTAPVPLSPISLDVIFELIAIGVSVLVGALLIRYLKRRRHWP